MWAGSTLTPVLSVWPATQISLRRIIKSLSWMSTVSRNYGLILYPSMFTLWVPYCSETRRCTYYYQGEIHISQQALRCGMQKFRITSRSCDNLVERHAPNQAPGEKCTSSSFFHQIVHPFDVVGIRSINLRYFRGAYSFQRLEINLWASWLSPRR